MKHVITLILVIPLMVSAQRTERTDKRGFYKYHYELVKPVQDTALKYSDDKMEFRFTFGITEIAFSGKNKTDEVLKVVWDEASIVLMGTAEKVMHKGIRFIERDQSMSPTTIPPNSTIQDLIIPTKNVYYTSGTYGGWNTRDLFPTSDLKRVEFKNAIDSLKGQEIVIYLPIRNNKNDEYGYSFTFRIKEVECTSCTPPEKNRRKRSKG